MATYGQDQVDYQVDDAKDWILVHDDLAWIGVDSDTAEAH